MKTLKFVTEPLYLFGIWWMVAGALDLYSLFVDNFPLYSNTLSLLPDPIEIGIAFILLLAGIFITAGMLWRGAISTEWLFEKLGWMLGLTGWLCYSLVVFVAIPNAFLVWGNTLVLASVAASRLFAIVKLEKSIREQVIIKDV